MKPFFESAGLTVSALAEVTRRRRANGPLDPRWSFRTEFFQTMVRRMMDRGLVKGPQWLRGVQAAVPSALPPALRKAVRFEPLVADGVPASGCGRRACRRAVPTRRSPTSTAAAT